jgi:hypothetical protein
MQQRFSLLIIFVFLAGCVASANTIQPTPETVKSYQIGKTYEANIGSPIIEGGRVNTVPAFKPVESIQPPAAWVSGELPELKSNQIWTAVGRMNGGYLLDPPESYPDEGHKLSINSDGSIADGGWFADEGGNVPDRGEWPEGGVFERAEPQPLEGSFEFEILYTGKDGETVTMTYREYLDGMQRADYSQDLSYNIAEQDTIRFRSIQIQVKEATNSSIRYKIIEDGGLPWLQ